jgi:uncharacterized protein YbjT (DUF2867 family)
MSVGRGGKTILVTGATGNVGTELIGILGKSDDIALRARGAWTGRRAPLAVKGAEVVEADLNRADSLRPALTGVHAVFLLSGYDGLAQSLADMREAGVVRVVLLSGGGAAVRNTDNPISAYQLGSEGLVRASHLEWTILRP